MAALSVRVYELLYGGARGGGKTDAGINWMISDDYYQNALFRGLVIRKNYADLGDWIVRAARFYRGLGAKLKGGIGGKEFVFPSGATIVMGHLKDENAFEKYQGQEYQRELIEELTHIRREEDYLKLIGSCRSTVPGLVPGIFCTANPTGRGHSWVKKRFVRGDGVPKPAIPFLDPKSGRTRLYIPARVFDNPTLIKNDPGYVGYLKGLPSTLRKAWLGGSWDVTAGQFFEEWNEVIHVVKPFKIPFDWPRIICGDYGYTAPSAIYWLAIDPKSGKVYAYRELYVVKHTYDMLMRAIARLTPGDENIDWMVVDNSVAASGKESGKTGLQQMNEVLEELKWTLLIRLATKGPDSRAHGWNLMRDYLKPIYDNVGNVSAKLQVFSTCTELIRVMPDQMIDEDKIEDLDTDGEDHAPDAIRYGLKSLQEPIKIIKKKQPMKNKGFTNEELFDKIESEAEARQ